MPPAQLTFNVVIIMLSTSVLRPLYDRDPKPFTDICHDGVTLARSLYICCYSLCPEPKSDPKAITPKILWPQKSPPAIDESSVSWGTGHLNPESQCTCHTRHHLNTTKTWLRNIVIAAV
jgi:hypothetical protein